MLSRYTFLWRNSIDIIRNTCDTTFMIDMIALSPWAGPSVSALGFTHISNDTMPRASFALVEMMIWFSRYRATSKMYLIFRDDAALIIYKWPLISDAFDLPICAMIFIWCSDILSLIFRFKWQWESRQFTLFMIFSFNDDAHEHVILYSFCRCVMHGQIIWVHTRAYYHNKY